MRVIDITIDEAITDEKEIANMLYDQQRPHSAYYHKQLAEFLEELKSYREIGTVEECRNSVLNIPEAYNKAIDDLLEDANEMSIEVDTGTYTMKAIGIGLLKKIAEKLKAGGENGQSI